MIDSCVSSIIKKVACNNGAGGYTEVNMKPQSHLNEPQGPIKNKKLPDATGHFGQFGGRYVPETLMPALLELEDAYNQLKDNPDFQQEFRVLPPRIRRTTEPALLR